MQVEEIVDSHITSSIDSVLSNLFEIFNYSIRPQTFELSKKYGFSQITFFRKVRETNIHSESFLKFDSAHFGILIDTC